MKYFGVKLENNRWDGIKIPVYEDKAPVAVVMAALLVNIPLEERHEYLMVTRKEQSDKYMESKAAFDDPDVIQALKENNAFTNGIDLDKVAPKVMAIKTIVPMVAAAIRGGTFFTERAAKAIKNKKCALAALNHFAEVSPPPAPVEEEEEDQDDDEDAFLQSMMEGFRKKIVAETKKRKRELEDDYEKKKAHIEELTQANIALMDANKALTEEVDRLTEENHKQFTTLDAIITAVKKHE